MASTAFPRTTCVYEKVVAFIGVAVRAVGLGQLAGTINGTTNTPHGVYFSCYRLQMVGIDARPNAAEMIKIESDGNGSLCCRKDLSMRIFWFPFDGHYCVAVGLYCASPQPATAHWLRGNETLKLCRNLQLVRLQALVKWFHAHGSNTFTINPHPQRIRRKGNQSLLASFLNHSLAVGAGLRRKIDAK